LGSSLLSIKEEATPLQIQIEKFVKVMAIIGIVIFCWFGLSIFCEHTDLLNSLLKGLTLAMSILPKNQLAFTTFMALDPGD
jgi:Ca2+-transporting ATPase